jgi:hypothetical protein
MDTKAVYSHISGANRAQAESGPKVKNFTYRRGSHGEN